MKRSTVGIGILALACVGVLSWAQGSAPPLPANARADHVVVKKAARVLELYNGAELLRAYPISLGPHPQGPKQREGDGRTPEGRYTLDYRKANSSFHRALHVSYPLPADTAAAEAQGAVPGGLIMIHGLLNGLGFIGRLHTFIDWTDGCIAVTNREIEEIWRVVPDGAPVLIEP